MYIKHLLLGFFLPNEISLTYPYRSENEITNKNEMSPEQAEENKSNQQLLMNPSSVKIMTPSSVKMSTKKYRAHVLSTSTIFVVDNVKLYVKNSVPSSFGEKGKIFLESNLRQGEYKV